MTCAQRLWSVVCCLLQVQQGQTGTAVEYATPHEYMVTSQTGDCVSDESSSTTATTTTAAYVISVTNKYAAGRTPINFNSDTRWDQAQSEANTVSRAREDSQASAITNSGTVSNQQSLDIGQSGTVGETASTDTSISNTVASTKEENWNYQVGVSCTRPNGASSGDRQGGLMSED